MRDDKKTGNINKQNKVPTRVPTRVHADINNIEGFIVQ